jgi:hypothetical protein
MARKATQCPKCNGRMEQGFIIDFTHGGRMVSSWAPGAPQKSFWRGTYAEEDRLVPIGAFRCESCGFLESYARDEFAAK